MKKQLAARERGEHKERKNGYCFDFYLRFLYFTQMLKKILGLFWSTKVALVLLVLISLSCVVGVNLPPGVGKEAVFTSLWFNALLLLLIVNIVFCITKRTRIFRVSQLGTTIFHLGLVLLFAGAVYDQLFFFEGAIRLTEGEALSCSDPASYDRAKMGRFFQVEKLDALGDLYLHKLHAPYVKKGKEKGIASEIAVGDAVFKGENRFVYVTHPLEYKGFEIYRDERDGYSPLFVLRDRLGRVLHGAYAPLQSIQQKDGTYLYRSGTALVPGSFNFPQEPDIPALFRLRTTYHPDKANKMTGEVSFQIWPIAHGEETDGREEKELFTGRAAFGERVRVGEYLLAMDEVRYWSSMNVIYRPGLPFIFGSFWVSFGGLVLNLIMKTVNPTEKDSALTYKKIRIYSGFFPGPER